MRVALSASNLGELPAAVEVAAYRIAIEGVTNAARHANATQCTLDICRAHDLRVEITDDGAGLPARWQPGVGIASMRERAAQLGGTLTITTPCNGGTSVTATLPIDGG
jgi:signal transduction histidine kinase